VSNLLVFDLDGVITSEAAYWDAAGMALHELLYSPRYWDIDRQGGQDTPYHPAMTAQETRRASRSVFPESEIVALKARAINSNWDTCYTAACFQLIELLATLPDLSGLDLLPLRPWNPQWNEALRARLSSAPPYQPQQVQGFDRLDEPPFRGYIGIELMNRCDLYASERLGVTINGVFARNSPFWNFCRDLFQEWYMGDELYTRTYGRAPAQSDKPGCIHFDVPLLPSQKIRDTLHNLRERGYLLGIATGRERLEALYPLRKYDLLACFDEQHISTYDDVERAESILRARGDATLLTKPHPYPYLYALNHAVERDPASAKASAPFIVVGDSTSDILGGRAAGALTVAVLTGARTAEAHELLARSRPDFTIEDMTGLPALLDDLDDLATIQRLQFTERAKAERLLHLWFARHMHLQTEQVTLTPKAVSLNSFNGFYRSNGEEFFFKTHVEEQGVLAEYYHAQLLSDAGYNIVRPLRALHEGGQQMVIYPVVRWPVIFDLAHAIETGDTTDTAASQGVTAETLAAAEREEDARLVDIYRATLAASTAEQHAQAPIHQLFWHRLAGGRLASFYAGKSFSLPGFEREELPFEEILMRRWIINGMEQRYTLGELIERARVTLRPDRAAMTIIGHGDAHFGNVFLEQESRYLYFDPAFAGRHSPLLDVVKPLFHNIFATWMYFPFEVARDLQLSLMSHEKTIEITHNFGLTSVRQAILRAKVESLLRPLLDELDERGALPGDWRDILRLALMCCPLLTINLADSERMPSAISWLGLSLAVQVGNNDLSPWGIEL
jgi:phosphoglycolate phosphatase-like HAD superfamily hydrolase